jgi:hypothetical protein
VNAFIMAASGQTLLALFRRRIPDIVTAMRSAVRRDLASRSNARVTADLYAQLSTIDFSHDILPGQASGVVGLARRRALRERVLATVGRVIERHQ